MTAQDNFKDDSLFFYVLVFVLGLCTTAYFGYALGYDDGTQFIMNEAVEVGVGEYYENYQTMDYEFRWITVDKTSMPAR